MRFFGITLGFIGVASAADIRNHGERNCDGGYLVCSNIPDNMCCSTYDGTTGAASLGYANLPNRGVTVIGYDPLSGYACGFEVINGYVAGGSGDACMNPPKGTTAMSGGSWIFDGDRATTGGDNRKCTGSQMVDTVVLMDGLKFKVQGMKETMVKALYAMAWNGTVKDDVPGAFAQFAAVE